jgi:hypothetical protein
MFSLSVYMQRLRWFRAQRATFLPLSMLVLVPFGSVAAEAVVPPANFSTCASMVDPTARLACYDAASGRAKVAPSVPTAPAEPSEGPPRVSAASPAESRFGDNGQLRDAAEARRDTPSQIEAYVKHVATLPNGRYLLTLDNDQVWQTTEADWALEFNPEDSVTISRLPMGGYRIALSGENRSLGVKRTH